MPRQEGVGMGTTSSDQGEGNCSKSFYCAFHGRVHLNKEKKKKERITCFIGKMILFEKSRKLRLGRANCAEAHASPENRGGGLKGGDWGGAGSVAGYGQWAARVAGSKGNLASCRVCKFQGFLTPF